MKNTLSLFVQQFLEFWGKNRWVFVVFAAALWIIHKTNRGNVLGVTTIFSLHFIADIFVMMMGFDYSQKNFRAGTRYQIISTAIFFGLTLYTGLFQNNWQYFSPEPIYVLAALKNYWKDMKLKEIFWINSKSASLLAVFIIGTVCIPLALINGFSQWIQMLGIFLFAIALCTTHDEKLRYGLSILGLVGMVGGSVWEVINTFLAGNVIGLALSYLLLPLTVLIVYLRAWTVHFPPGSKR